MLDCGSQGDCLFHSIAEALNDNTSLDNINYYENAGHGFFCEERESFRPDSAKDAWAKTLDFFNTYCP